MSKCHPSGRNRSPQLLGVSTVIPNTILFVDSRERNRKFVDFGLARGGIFVERESRESLHLVEMYSPGEQQTLTAVRGLFLLNIIIMIEFSLLVLKNHDKKIDSWGRIANVPALAATPSHRPHNARVSTPQSGR